MTTQHVRCRCGELFHVDAARLPGRVQCRRCGCVITVKRKSASIVARLRAALSRWRSTVGRHRQWRRSSQLDRGARARRGPAQRAIDVLAWTYFVGALGIAAVLWGFADEWWPATVLLFSGRWIFATPLLLLAPAAAVLSRRALVPVAAAAIIIAGPVMGGRMGLGSLARGGGPALRVVTFNVEGGGEVARHFDALLAEWHPDVFAAQECGDELAAVLRQQRGWTVDRVGGLCLLSRYPVLSRTVMDRSALEAIRADGAQIGGSGAVVRYGIRTPLGLVQFTNVHLETPRWGLQDLLDPSRRDPTRLELNTRLRDVESELARREVDAGGGPAIVVGDFNTPAESRIFRRHWGDLSDAFTAAGVGLGMTKYNGWIRVRIDHVLVDRSLRVVRARVGADAGSDHRPLLVDLVAW